MNAHEQHIGDAAAFQQVPDLGARVADRVFILDFDGSNLRLPGRSLGALRPVVAAAVGLVDRIDPLLFGRDLVAPLADVLGRVRGLGRRVCPFSTRVILVSVHTTAGGVDDENALGTGRGDRPVHCRGYLANPPCRGLAPVLVPHVTDDEGKVCAEASTLRTFSSTTK